MQTTETTAQDGLHFTDDYLAYLLSRASQLVSRQFHARLATEGMRVGEWRVLATLSDRGAVTVGQLAKITLLKQPTLTRVVARMEASGWVSRRTETEDRRITQVSITAVGKTVVADLLAKAKAHEAQVLGGYSPADVRTMKAGLRTLITRLEDNSE